MKHENVLGVQWCERTSFAPFCIREEAFQTELLSNWHEVFETVKEEAVPTTANAIGSHVVCNVKQQEDGEKTLKSKIVPHRNRDTEMI